MTPKEYIENARQTMSGDAKAISKRLSSEETVQLLHAALGMVTEAAEFADIMKKYIFYGKPMDQVNLEEEMGDICWYISIALDSLGVTWEEIFEQNISKLRSRYGEKFSEARAITRDLESERRILEGRNKELSIHLGDGKGLRLYVDGDQWCCVNEDFVNLQESICGFGDTPEEALISYHTEKLRSLK